MGTDAFSPGDRIVYKGTHGVLKHGVLIKSMDGGNFLLRLDGYVANTVFNKKDFTKESADYGKTEVYEISKIDGDMVTLLGNGWFPKSQLTPLTASIQYFDTRLAFDGAKLDKYDKCMKCIEK